MAPKQSKLVRVDSQGEPFRKRERGGKSARRAKHRAEAVSAGEVQPTTRQSAARQEAYQRAQVAARGRCKLIGPLLENCASPPPLGCK